MKHCPFSFSEMGCHLEIVIGPALMAKIINEDGQVLHRSMYQALIQKEWNSKSAKPNVVNSWSPQTRCYVLVEDTLKNNLHENKLQNAVMFSMLDEVNTEWGDQYVNAEILQKGQDGPRLSGMLEM